MHQLQQSWVQSQHPSAQWNLRGGRWSSAEYSTRKKLNKSPKKYLKKNFVRDGRYIERGWACTPHPHQPGIIFPSWWNVRQKGQLPLYEYSVICMHAHPRSLYLPSRTKLWCSLQLRGQIYSPYFYSSPICSLWDNCTPLFLLYPCGSD